MLSPDTAYPKDDETHEDRVQDRAIALWRSMRSELGAADFVNQHIEDASDMLTAFVRIMAEAECESRFGLVKDTKTTAYMAYVKIYAMIDTLVDRVAEEEA